MIKRIVILGGGSAGFLAALALKTKLPELQVIIIRSKEIGIIGVGEGSALPLTRFLQSYIRVSPAKFYSVAQPTWKLGLKFLWGPRSHFHFTFTFDQMLGPVRGLTRKRSYYCWDEMEYEDAVSAMMTQNRAFEQNQRGDPIFHPYMAFHVENENFVRFLEETAVALGVVIRDDTVTEVEQNENGVAALRLGSGQRETADLYVDASGFASVLLGKALGEPFESYKSSLFCDRTVVGGWARKDPEDMIIKPYTTCETMDSGWCWQIEHENRINRGYVYSSGFISDENAEKEFRRKNPKVGPTRVVPFIAGRYRNFWVKNVVAVGNAAGFVEPLEATALGTIAMQSMFLTELLVESDCDLAPSAQQYFNRFHTRFSDEIRDFLAVHYKFNQRFDTPFWRHCWEATELYGAAETVEIYRENGPCMWLDERLDRANQFGAAGYVVMLLGQKIEYRRRYQPKDAERQIWNAERERLKQTAMRGLTVKETLEKIRSPKFTWAVR